MKLYSPILCTLAACLLLAPRVPAQPPTAPKAVSAIEAASDAGLKEPGQIAAPHPVRQRFVPAPREGSKGRGASFSALHQLPADKPGVLMLISHAGVGDSFPVQEEHGPKLFEVAIVSGDDDLLKVEFRLADKASQHDLKRDATVSFTVAGHKFLLSYPSVTVSSASPPTSDQVMLIVNRLAD